MHQLSLIIALLISFGYNTYATPYPPQKEGMSIREALNKAARQQTLTQRIAKVYLALNNNLYEPTFYQERDQAIEEFQKQLDELKWYTPTEKIKTALKSVQDLWTEYKAIADWSINDEGASKLLSQCDHILTASKHLINAYDAYARELGAINVNSELVNVSSLIQGTGTQRMLTQRVMLYYLAATQDIEKDVSLRKLQVTRKEYDFVLKKLGAAEINSPKIQTEIKTMEKYWKGLNKYLD